MSVEETAKEIFLNGFNCSQAVFGALAPELGLSQGLAFKIATAFGGGMSRAGQTCGAVCGGLMVIGLKHGMACQEEKEAKEKAYLLGQEFMQRFAALHGSTDCRLLLDLDLSEPEGWQNARQLGVFKSRCPLFVETAVRLLAELA